MRRTAIADGSGQLPALERICGSCAGEGRTPQRRERSRIELGAECQACQGSGIVPTEDGRRLLEFLYWHRR